MSLRDPFAAYSATSNVEAHWVRNLLVDAGIEAVVIEDISQVAVFVGGLLPAIHNPQVWIERDAIEQARPILIEYEQHLADRRAAEQDSSGVGGTPVEVLCEECGQSCEFPVAQSGSVQNCPNCGAYIDVGDATDVEGWEETPGEGQEDASA